MSELQTAAKNAMPAIQQMLQSRYERGNLEKGVAYVQVNQTGRTKVGTFQYTGYRGSGDGMQICLVFELNGKYNEVKDQMWGSVSGSELSYFEKDE